MSLGIGSGMSISQLRRHRKEKLVTSVKRLALSKGVFGVMVTTETWTVIDSTFDPSLAHYWKKQMKFVEELGIAIIRDSDPKNDLNFLRVQTTKYEILLSIAKDHRVLVVFSSTNKDPLKGALQMLKQKKRKQWEFEKSGNRIRMAMDPCAPHTKIIGGQEKVVITEKISGKLIDQNDDISKL